MLLRLVLAICQVRAGGVVLLTLSLVSGSWREQTGGHHESERADGAEGAVEDHSVGRGELPGQALRVHAGVPEHSGQEFPKDPLYQGGEWPVSVTSGCFNVQRVKQGGCMTAMFNMYFD